MSRKEDNVAKTTTLKNALHAREENDSREQPNKSTETDGMRGKG